MLHDTVSTRIEFERVDDVSGDSRVCHYDELDETAKARLPSLVETDGRRVDDATARGFDGCEVVKYTDYYRVSLR